MGGAWGQAPWALWGPVALYTAFIFWVSSRPRPIPGIEIFPQMDKVAHAVEYFGLGILWVRALKGSWPSRSGWLLWGGAWAACLLTGALDEMYQFPIPGKETDFWDFFSDGAGAALGQALYLGELFFRGKRTTAQTP